MFKNKLPYVSVVLTAYNRQTYLPNALKSLTSQKLDFDAFEVILLTNFDVDISLLQEFQTRGGNLKRLKIDGPMGLYFEKAVEISSGEVLCFLDDDDSFSFDKLQVVMNIFQENKKIGYYSNYMNIINDYGEIYKNRTKIGNITKTRNDIKMIINRDSDFKLIKRFIVYGGNAFNSTISIRKSILESYKSTLKYALRAEDEILFAIALDSGYNLILNSLQLTNYRISASNSSRISYKSNNSLNNRCNVLKKEIDTFSGILNIENLFKSQITRQYLTNAYSFYLLFYSSICSRCQKHPNHELIKSVKNLLLPIKTSNLFLFVLYFTSMIDKKFARRLYIIFRGD